MIQLDELLARSREPGVFTERRQFTLSREKAIEKQREFALRHPRQYVLELIQGAIFGGATYMAIDARKDSILIAWVGAPPLTETELEHIFDYLFADRSNRQTRHLVQLAVGINALLQRKPRSIRLESGNGEHTVRLELSPNGDAQIGTVKDPIHGTYLVAEFGGTSWMARFLSELAPTPWTQVTELIESKCMYTPIPILLNGNAPFGFRASRNVEIFGTSNQLQFDTNDRRGVIAMHASPDAQLEFRIVVGGVWITELPLRELSTEPMLGVICDDNLRKTADHSDIVQDVRFLRMLHAIQPFATELLRRRNPSYTAPKLAPIPEISQEEGTPDPQKARVERETLPDAIPLLGVRGFTSLAALQKIEDEPIFWCTPEVGADSLRDVADPERFPFRVLSLSEGQYHTLIEEIPQAQLHRLNAPADVDFVLRIMERSTKIRATTVKIPQGELTVRLHLEGRLPAWGNGLPGVPLLVQHHGVSLVTGCIHDAKVYHSKTSPYALRVALNLPDISLIVRIQDDTPIMVDDNVAHAAIEAAWSLAAPESGAPHPTLLAALLGTQCLPQFREGPNQQVCLEAALPPSWPPRLRSVPLIDTSTGPLSFDGFLETIRSNQVVTLKSEAQLARMRPLQERFGFGHLRLPRSAEVGRVPPFAVARVHGRWRWVRDPSIYSSGSYIGHIVYVSRHFHANSEEAGWVVDARPAPELVALRRNGEDPRDYEEAWWMLFEGLQQQRWNAEQTNAPELAQLSQLALIHLSELLNQTDTPLLLPSDGGAKWSLSRLRTDPSACVAAANGIQIAEPTTLLMTYDLYRAVSPEGELRLRYDDHPDVWKDLGSSSDEGWLLRTEVNEVRLRGWLGLRRPFDGTSGILLRTTGTLVAQRDLDERIPCHGLIWPLHGSHHLSSDEQQLLQLAGLKMYSELAHCLRDHTDPEARHTAQLYAWGFCYRAYQRGRLTGTALQLAQLVEVHTDQGRTWGNLARWLTADPATRPSPPAAITLPPELPQTEKTITGPLTDEFDRRLRAAIPAELSVDTSMSVFGAREAATILRKISAQTIYINLNTAHPLVKDAQQGVSLSRELLLLEVARKLAIWGQSAYPQLSLNRLQQVLLSQRFQNG